MSFDTFGRLWRPHDDFANPLHSHKGGIQINGDSLLWMGYLVWIVYRTLRYHWLLRCFKEN